MFKSLTAGVLALLASVFGLFHPNPPVKPVATAQPAIVQQPPAPQAAPVELTIVNDYFAAPTTLIAGTRFKTADGRVFLADQRFTVPGKHGAANGTITISATAVAPGQNPTGRLSLPGLAASPAQYAHIYATAAAPAAAQSASAALAASDAAPQQSPVNSIPSSNKTTQQFQYLSSPQHNPRPQTNPSTATVNPDQQYVTKQDLSAIFGGLGRVVALLPGALGTGNFVTHDFLTRQIERTSDNVSDSIDNHLPLGGGTLTGNLTVDGVTGLATADIPDLSASYLSSAGGTVAGNLTVTGAFSGGALSLANASTTLLSVLGPAYFGSTATSTFGADGSLILASALGVASGGTGTTSWQTGSIPFFNGTNLTEDNSNLFWSSTSHFLGIGTGSPAAQLVISPGSGISAPAWGVTGIALSIPAGTYTDTTSSGTASPGTSLVDIEAPTIAVNTAASYNVPVTLRIGGAPIAGANATLTSPLAFKVASGNATFSGFVGLGTNNPASQFIITGSQSASSWTTNGLAFSVANGQTYTDTSTAANSTITTRAVSSFMTPTLAFTNATSTISQAATLYINGAPTAQASSTIITNAYALMVNSGASLFKGNLNITPSGNAATQGNALTIGNASLGNTGTATANGITLSDNANGSSWDTTNPFVVLDFSSTDVSTVGSGVRARIGTVMQNAAGGLTRLGFFTAPTTAGTMVEDMAITAAGLVGIGTTTPNNKLDIYSTTKAALGFNTNSGLSDWTIGQDASDGGKFKISSSTALGTNDRFVIDGNGNVGIGTTSPTENLTVTNPSSTATFSLKSAGNSIGSGNVRFDLVNGDGNKYDWQYSGSGGTILRLQYNGASKDVFNTDGSLAVGRSASTAFGAMLSVEGTQYIASSTNPTSANLLGFYGGSGANIGFISNSSTSTWNLGYGPASTLATLATPVLTWNSSGNVGIGTTSPWRTLSVSGTVAFAGLTTDTADAKTLCLTSANEVVANTGSTCITSSQRFKTDIEPLATSSGLTEVMRLNPVSFDYKQSVGVPGEQVGFIAEQVQTIDPRLVVLDASGTPFTVRYENLTAILAKAIQEIASVSGAFRTNLIAWLADAANGIGDLFASSIHAKEELCVGSTCVTPAQFQAMVAATGQRSAVSGPTAPSVLPPAASPSIDPTSTTISGVTTTAASSTPGASADTAATTTNPDTSAAEASATDTTTEVTTDTAAPSSTASTAPSPTPSDGTALSGAASSPSD